MPFMGDQAHLRVIITALYFDFASPRAEVHARRVLTLDDYAHPHVAQTCNIAPVVHTVLSAAVHTDINM